METLRFLKPAEVCRLADEFGAPLFVYDQAALTRAAEEALAFPAPYGLTVRFAMKANPNAAVLRLFDSLGLHIDASSEFEAWRALRAGIAAERIMLTAQQAPARLADLVKRGVRFNATSLRQLAAFGAEKLGDELAIRVNPGLGSGHTNRTNVGGPASSFGIWHEQLDEAAALARRYGLRITKLHTHIGSGSDPAVWQRVAGLCLDIAARLDDVVTLSLGGGYKVARMPGEPHTDFSVIGTPVRDALADFAQRTGRRLRLEIEPGAYLTANAGALIAAVCDTNDTGPDGYHFLKLDTGMTDILRPSLYGAQHPLVVVRRDGHVEPTRPTIVVGHCCESGDVLTPAPGDPEALAPRELTVADAGDLVVIEAAGAYCAAMCAKNYNSFPESPEVLRGLDGAARLIRRRQSLEHMLANEQIDALTR